MRAERIAARGFRNLVDFDLTLPPAGAVFLGPNGHGKTNLLELLYYPVLFRSLRGAMDSEVTRFGDSGFQLELVVRTPDSRCVVGTTFIALGKRKQITVDGVPPERRIDAVGQWLAVAFLPTDLALVQGPATGRRQYLDRVLSLSSPTYLRTLARYRLALAQRNAALRRGEFRVATAFDGPLATHGAGLVRQRYEWVTRARGWFADECERIGEPNTSAADLTYRGKEELIDPERWPLILAECAGGDQQRRATSVGPHRDDLVLSLGGRSLREFGSTGQQRSAALALKLCELRALGERQTAPALLLDDAFAELDRGRQERFARRLHESGPRQIFVTTPRLDELPRPLELPIWSVRDGTITQAGEGVPS